MEQCYRASGLSRVPEGGPAQCHHEWLPSVSEWGSKQCYQGPLINPGIRDSCKVGMPSTAEIFKRDKTASESGRTASNEQKLIIDNCRGLATFIRKDLTGWVIHEENHSWMICPTA